MNTISNFREPLRYIEKGIAFGEYQSFVMIYDVTGSRNILAASQKRARKVTKSSYI